MPSFAPLFIIELLKGLGLGGQIFIVAVLLFAAYEAYRVIMLGQRAGGFLGSIGFYAIVVLVVIAAIISMGWVTPNVSVVTDHMSWAFDAGWRFVSDQLARMY